MSYKDVLVKAVWIVLHFRTYQLVRAVHCSRGIVPAFTVIPILWPFTYWKPARPVACLRIWFLCCFKAFRWCLACASVIAFVQPPFTHQAGGAIELPCGDPLTCSDPLCSGDQFITDQAVALVIALKQAGYFLHWTPAFYIVEV